MTDRSKTQLSDNVREAIAEQAFDWLLRLDPPDADKTTVDKTVVGKTTNAEFTAWLKQSPVHIEEFLTIEAVWRELDNIDPSRKEAISELIAGVRDNVLPLSANTRNAANPAGPVAHTRRFGWAKALAAGLATLVVGVLVSRIWMPQADSYVTILGEQSSFTLLDGSVVHLNTQSEIRVQFEEHVRNVQLLKGEALFNVAKDAERPFRVTAAGTVVEAIGTSFNVYFDINQTTVTVVEGKVAVQNTSLPTEPVLLLAGDQVEVNPTGGIARLEAPDTQEVTAWRDRQLVFRNATLADIAEQFNRYNRVRIQVRGAVSQRRLSGVFDADDPESMIDFLSGESAIRVVQEAGLITISDR